MRRSHRGVRQSVSCSRIQSQFKVDLDGPLQHSKIHGEPARPLFRHSDFFQPSSFLRAFGLD